MQKGRMMAVIAVLSVVLSTCIILFSCSSSQAEEPEPGVTEYTAADVMVAGEKVEAFEYLGIIYAVTSDEESAEEAGVYGISSSSAVEGAYHVCVNSFEFGEGDDAITYSVTSVLSEFRNSGASGDSLILSVSIETFEEGCFEGLGLTGLVVSDAVDSEMMAATGLSDSDYTFYDDSAPADYLLTVSAGRINGNVVDSYNGGERSAELAFYRITAVLECPFENPGFDADCYADASDNAIPEGAQVCIIAGVLYADGAAYTGAADIEVQWSENEDYLADFEIGISLPFFEICTFTGTYEMWMMYATTGIILLLALIGLSMFGYRHAMARKG